MVQLLKHLVVVVLGEPCLSFISMNLSIHYYQGLYNVNVTRLCVEMEVGKTSRYAK